MIGMRMTRDFRFDGDTEYVAVMSGERVKRGGEKRKKAKAQMNVDKIHTCLRRRPNSNPTLLQPPNLCQLEYLLGQIG